MEDFLTMYGPFLLLGVFLVYLIGINVYRTKKYNGQAKQLIDSLKKGDYVKTYAGIYGTVVELSEKTLENEQIEKQIKLEVSENSYITVDANSVYVVLNELKAPKKRKKAVKPVEKEEE